MFLCYVLVVQSDSAHGFFKGLDKKLLAKWSNRFGVTVLAPEDVELMRTVPFLPLSFEWYK